MPDPGEISNYPRPWHAVEKQSGIVIKDATGVSVLTVPFSGLKSKEAKRRVAQLVLRAVNTFTP